MDFMPDYISMEKGVAVTLALSAVKRYVLQPNVGGYSLWCVVGGFAAMESASIGKMLPDSVNKALDKTLGFSAGEIVGALLGGIALEVAVNGSLSVGAFTSIAGIEVIVMGTLASLGGIYAAKTIGALLNKPVTSAK